MFYILKIKNFEAAAIHEFQDGFRGYLYGEDAAIVDSLFLDFLLENGLDVYKEKSTRDIVCLQFSYGTKDYETMLESVDKLIEAYDSTTYYKELREYIVANKEKCVGISKQDLRTLYYRDGCDITYDTYNKGGKLIKSETIHYKMLYRTPGKAKKGTCMFIMEELYDKAHEFIQMGIELPQHNAPIVEMGAYSSLITSSTIGKIKIKPEQILVVEDFDSYYSSTSIIVDIDENKHCFAKEVADYTDKNTMFDGQALIDSSIFPEWADGYILLRQHMTKCAAFNTNIELFMREHFGDSYETATITDMFGRDVRVKDIKLITTDNAMKWIKFDVGFEHFAEWLYKNDCMWGVVKTSHESKLGTVQRMSYQMVNSLNMEDMPEIIETSCEYIHELKNNDKVFLDYLRKNINFSNDFDVLVALCEHNPDFVYSSYYKERKKSIIRSYVTNFKSGRVIQNADNLTIVGSPYAMLMHSVGLNPEDDPTFEVEEGAIQVWTNRFEDGEYLAEFRNPFNSRNNMGYIHNVHHNYFDKYFNLGKLCIAVNMKHTDFQNRNNGLTKWVGSTEM